ncbi:MAG: class I SAM-dependent methyltransferase [Candidatus Levybacteria bacterium]|nr:class I SAM-dependent methyltransferase [Candidatus Levybacteria bacterium]
MNTKSIKKCRSCFSGKLINILSLGEQYLSDFSEGKLMPSKSPLDLMLCRNCNLVQLKHTVYPSLLYTERYGYKSGINNTMKEELQKIVISVLKKINNNEEITALDIGANDGTLLSYYPKNVFKIAFEPIEKFAKESKMHANVVINDFFDSNIYMHKLKRQKANIITAISCFYDIDKPNDFIEGIKKILQKDGVFVIQQNYLVGMIINNAFDNIVHEHLEYYSILSLENLLSRHGLEIFHVEESSINGGSFITFVAHKNSRSIQESVFRWRENEKALKLDRVKIYKDFARRVNKNKKDLYLLIEKLDKEGKNVYVYGASTRGNTLLQFYQLNNSLIKAAVERNPEKWGKNISSVGIPIISEEQARKQKPDYMLVLPWFFKEEFLEREKRYLESGGHFIFPLPKIEII